MAIICIIVGALGFLEMNTSTGAAMVAFCSLWAFVYANSLAPIGRARIQPLLPPQANTRVGWISLVQISSPRLCAKTSAVVVTIQ